MFACSCRQNQLQTRFSSLLCKVEMLDINKIRSSNSK